MENKYFSGGNTGVGFFNLFDGIVPKNSKARTIILKGGPGVGKSTLMKRIANVAKEQGKSVEYFYCSGDPDSLDAVRIIEDEIVVVDGTAPHIIDPVYPGISDEILNLGVYIKQEELRKHKETVLPLFAENKKQYTIAYSYLNTAMVLKKTNISAFEGIFDMEAMAEGIREKFNLEQERGAYTRSLFKDAITCKGRMNFLSDIPNTKNTYCVKGDARLLYVSKLLELSLGKAREVFFEPLLGNVPAHIHFVNEDIWVTTGDVQCENVIDTDEYRIKETPEYVAFNEMQIEELIKKAISHLENCKRIHDDMEDVYKKHMDFAGVSAATEKLLKELY